MGSFRFEDYTKRTKRELRKVSFKALTRVGNLISSQCQALAAVDTGELRDSIQSIVKEYGGDVRVFVGTNVEYSVFVEFGTGEFAENGLGRKGGWLYRSPDGKVVFTYGNEPQPFIRPAFKKNKKRAQDIIAQTFVESFGD